MRVLLSSVIGAAGESFRMKNKGVIQKTDVILSAAKNPPAA